MPVGLGSDGALLLPHTHSPTGEVNGENLQDGSTDVEDLYSEGDQSPMPKRKTLFVPPRDDAGALTDIEDMDLSGEEEDIIPEKKNLLSIEELGLLPEPVKEAINLTEGFARGASPLFASESDLDEETVDNMKGCHKKSLQKVDQQSQLELPDDDDAEGLTDVENLIASGDEEVEVEVEESLPEHYLDQGKDVSNKFKMKPRPKTSKICLFKEDESTDDEGTCKRVSHSKFKDNLHVEGGDGERANTDVEDLVLSDKAEDKQEFKIIKTKEKEKFWRKEVIRRKVVPKKPVPTAFSKTLESPAPGEAGGHTDVEVLIGDEDQSELQEDIYRLTVLHEDLGPLTDSKDVEASDVEVADDLVGQPIDKTEPAALSDPQRERVRNSEVEEPSKEESGGDTDEEGFQLKQPNSRRPMVHEPILDVAQDALEAEEPIESTLTDTEDIDMDEREENEMIEDIICRIPDEPEIYTIKELDESIGKVTKKEMIRYTDAELLKKFKEAVAAGLTTQDVMVEDHLTDVEDLEEVRNTRPMASKVVKGKKTKSGSNEESMSDSDGGEVQEPRKKAGCRGRCKLPRTPQLSEVRSTQTGQGPLTIIITEEDIDNVAEKVTDDHVDIVNLETDDRDEAKTDVEEISDGEIEVEVVPSNTDCPKSPLPPHLKYNVLESPKRELVHIKEDKHGVPQVTIRKLRKDEIFVSDMEDTGATDTEDIEVSEEEAPRLVDATEDSTADFELPNTVPTVVLFKMSEGNQLTPEKAEEERGTTDEQITLAKKSCPRAKGQSKFAVEPQDTDQEDKTRLATRAITPSAHTDIEDFETSENEVEEAPREDAPTPDIIRDAAILKTIVLKEGLHGTTYMEDVQIVPKNTSLLGVEVEGGGTTDVEDLEASGAEDDPPEHPTVELPEQESSNVDISERTSAPAGRNEDRQVKDNLLLPEDNLNTATDVESLGDGEGTHEVSQQLEQQQRPPAHPHHDQAEGGTTSQQAARVNTSAKVNVGTKKADGDSKFYYQNLKVDIPASEAKSEPKLEPSRSSESSCAGEVEVSETHEPGNLQSNIKATNKDDQSPVVLRESNRSSGPRPTTFPLCLLQHEVVSAIPEAEQYFRQQQEVLEELGRSGQGSLDVADLTDLTSTQTLAQSSEAEDPDGEVRQNTRKLVKSSSSYENLYDGADLRAAENQDAPGTAQLTGSLGDPFTTRTQLPPHMCSSFENLYMKAVEADPAMAREADLLAGEILEEAVLEVARGAQAGPGDCCPATPPLNTEGGAAGTLVV